MQHAQKWIFPALDLQFSENKIKQFLFQYSKAKNRKNLLSIFLATPKSFLYENTSF